MNAGGATRQDSGYKQEHYFEAALAACDPALKESECLGVALWQLTRSNAGDEPGKVKKTCNMPDHVRSSIWKILAAHANGK